MSAESPAYWAISIHCDQDSPEKCLEDWMEFPIESFMHERGLLIAYVKAEDWSEHLENKLGERLREEGLKWDKEYIPAKNWNDVWEAAFEPVRLEDWCLIRAEFHQSEEGFEHEILIRPEMAFGTGHHPTTYMMLNWLRDLDLQEKKVLDYGCGTGILAIMAKKLGASEVIGVDIEQPSIENAKLHEELNEVDPVKWYRGTLTDCPDENFDVILANINRNVLLATGKEINLKLNDKGTLIISGILSDDESLMIAHFRDLAFFHKETRKMGQWLAMLFTKR